MTMILMATRRLPGKAHTDNVNVFDKHVAITYDHNSVGA